MRKVKSRDELRREASARGWEVVGDHPVPQGPPSHPPPPPSPQPAPPIDHALAERIAVATETMAVLAGRLAAQTAPPPPVRAPVARTALPVAAPTVASGSPSTWRFSTRRDDHGNTVGYEAVSSTGRRWSFVLNFDDDGRLAGIDASSAPSHWWHFSMQHDASGNVLGMTAERGA